MNARPLHLALAGILAAGLLAGCGNRDAEREDAGELTPTTPAVSADTGMPPGASTTRAQTPAESTTAVDVREVTLGTEAGADRSITNPTTTFGPDDPVIVSVRTDGAASNVEIGARLVYQDGQVAGEEREALNTTGSETTNITFNNANQWPAGTYTVEVMVDGVRADSRTFNVQ